MANITPTVAWICSRPIFEAATATLKSFKEDGLSAQLANVNTHLAWIGTYHVLLACPESPSGSSMTVVQLIVKSFPHINGIFVTDCVTSLNSEVNRGDLLICIASRDTPNSEAATSVPIMQRAIDVLLTEVQDKGYWISPKTEQEVLDVEINHSAPSSTAGVPRGKTSRSPRLHYFGDCMSTKGMDHSRVVDLRKKCSYIKR
jgi:hypothetical protein